jgi:uncharacterized FlgJ-related protein
MIFRKLSKLYELRTRLYTLLERAKNSGADPDVITIRVNDLEYDIAKVNSKIEFEKVLRPFIYIIWIFLGIALFMLFSFMYTPRVTKIYYKTKVSSTITNDSLFTKEKLILYVNSLNLKFPHIILAQAQLESGNFTSHIFKSNNNFFGMKQARSRPTTCIRLQHGHAYYNNWKDCVIDYALYQAAYLKNIKTEEQYYNYIGRNYAENANYAKIVKKIAQNYK